MRTALLFFSSPKIAALQILASLQRSCNGDLDNVVKIHRIPGFVNSTNDFIDQARVMNGCSDTLGLSYLLMRP